MEHLNCILIAIVIFVGTYMIFRCRKEGFANYPYGKRSINDLAFVYQDGKLISTEYPAN